MRDDVRLKARYADLFQWVKDQGYWPKKFRQGHWFLIPVTQQIKAYQDLTPEQFRQALWVPDPEDVPFKVRWSHPEEAPDVFLIDLVDPATRTPVASGYGMTRIDALLSALQALRSQATRKAVVREGNGRAPPHSRDRKAEGDTEA